MCYNLMFYNIIEKYIVEAKNVKISQLLPYIHKRKISFNTDTLSWGLFTRAGLICSPGGITAKNFKNVYPLHEPGKLDASAEWQPTRVTRVSLSTDENLKIGDIKVTKSRQNPVGPFTRQIRVYQHEEVGEKVGENRGKFYLSPTVCQRVCRLFLCRSHTPT